MGRLAHRELTGGYAPQAPSSIKANGLVHRLRKPYEVPEEMSLAHIQKAIDEHAQAAHNALLAGFDGVEVHGAHGYLIDQFNSKVTNVRTDRYGGSQSQRLTFMKKILTAVVQEVGSERTIIRFSEHKDDIPDFKWSDPERTIKIFIDLFKDIGLQILHPSTNHFTEIMSNGMTFHQLVRKYWDGIIIGVGNLDVNIATNAIATGTIDLAAFGRPLIANPDFVQRVSHGKTIIPYDSKKHLNVLI